MFIGIISLLTLIYFLIGIGFYTIFIMTDMYREYKFKKSIKLFSILLFVFFWPITSIILSILFLVNGFKLW